MDLKAIGKFIKKLREEKGLSQNQLSEIVHVTRQAVSTWEVGRSLPDSSILLELSKLFDVSINELLQGQRNTNNSEKSQKLENITLSLVDNYNAKSKEIIKMIKLFLIIILFLLFILFSSYFFMSYNSIKVYRIYGSGTNFFTNDGLLIKTRNDMYLRLGKIQKKHKKQNIKINKIKLYYISKKGLKKVIYYDEKDNIILIDNNNYDEIPYKEFKYLKEKNKLFLEITYNNNKKETIKLKLEKKFSNKFNYYENKKISDKKYTINNRDIEFEKIEKKIKEKGHQSDGVFEYIIEDNNKIKFCYMKNAITIVKERDETTEFWRIVRYEKDTIIYEKYDGELKTNHTKINIKNIDKQNKKIYTEYINYINKYIFS